MKYRMLSVTEQQLAQANVEVTLDYTDLAALVGNQNSYAFAISPYSGGYGVTEPYVAVATPPTYAAGNVLSCKAIILDTPFVFSDASITASPFTLGDGGNAARYCASQETIGTGSYVKYSLGTGTRYVLTAADKMLATFTATAGHYLNTATAGSIRFLLKVEDLTLFPANG